MANQGSDLRKQGSQAPRTAKSIAKSVVNPAGRIGVHKAVKHKKAAKTQIVGGAAFVVAQRRQRTDLVMSEARKAGLLGGPKDAVIRGRVSTNLVKAAKKRAGVSSDTELLEVALSNLALEDDFGEKLLNRKGSIDSDLDLEF